MDPERRRQLYEVADILLHLFRCFAMYRALRTDVSDRLNFFRVYNGCLMDAAVVAWCKVFGSDREQSHWKKLYPEQDHDGIRDELAAEIGEQADLKVLWRQITSYRNRYVAHHVFDQAERPEQYPALMPLFRTGAVIYRRIYSEIYRHGDAVRLVPPVNCDDQNLDVLIAHWTQIADTARRATEHFNDDS